MRVWLTFPAKWLAYCLFRLPWRVRRFLGRGLGRLWFDVLRIRRQVVIDNIGIAFPELSYDQRVQMGREAMQEFCTNIIEFSSLPFAEKVDMSRFEFIGFENFDRAKAEGKGALILTLHLGHGDWAMAGMARHGYPVHLISKIFKTKWLNDAWFGMRGRVGVKFIAPRNSSYHVLKALKNNEIVCFVNDQFTGPPIGVKSKFFGRETGTGLGLAVIAERSKAPVIPGYTFRRPDGTTVVVFEPAIPFEYKGDRDESLAHMTQVYNDCLEQYVRLYPTQWMWLHKRWKKFKY